MNPVQIIRGSLIIRSCISEGKASRSSNMPTNKSLQLSAFSNKSNALTSSMIPLSLTNRPEYPITKSSGSIPYLSFSSLTFDSVILPGLNWFMVSTPLHVPFLSINCFFAGANLSSMLRDRTEGLTHTIWVAHNDATRSTVFNMNRFRPFDVSYTKPCLK